MFQNAKIIASDVKPDDYRTFGPRVDRGHEEFVMSRSELMDFVECPSKWIKGRPNDSTKSTEWGSLIDRLVLMPQFDSGYSVAPATYPSKGMKCPTCESVTEAATCRKCKTDRVEVVTQKPWDWASSHCQDWRAAQGNRSVIKADLKAAADLAVKRLLENDSNSELIACSKKSVFVTAEYADKATGLIVPVKILLDLVPRADHPRFGKSLADLKTAVSAKPSDFERAIFDHNYDTQAALYTDIYVAATGEDRCEWLFALQENQEPFEVADPMPALSSEFLDLGRMKYKHALEFYARCLADNHFPSYSAGSRLTVDGRYFSEPSPWMLSTAVEWPRLPDVLPQQCGDVAGVGK